MATPEERLAFVNDAASTLRDTVHQLLPTLVEPPNAQAEYGQLRNVSF